MLQKVANLGQPSLKLHNPTDTSLYVADMVRTFMYVLASFHIMLSIFGRSTRSLKLLLGRL